MTGRAVVVNEARPREDKPRRSASGGLTEVEEITTDHLQEEMIEEDSKYAFLHAVNYNLYIVIEKMPHHKCGIFFVYKTLLYLIQHIFHIFLIYFSLNIINNAL